jgi:hypothetical protein
VEKRQAAEDGEPVGEVEAGGELGDVGQHVAVAEHHALGFAGRAGGEKQGGLVIAAAAFVEAEQEAEDRAGRSLATMAQVMIFFLSVGSTRSMRIRSRFGGHGNEETLRTKGSAVMKRSTPAWRMHERIASWTGGEVEVHRGFAGEDDREVGDEAGLSGRQDDGDAGLVGFLADVWKTRWRGEDLVVAEFGVVGAVEDAVFRAVFLESLQQRHGQRAFEQGRV